MNDRMTLNTDGTLSIYHEYLDGEKVKVGECHNDLQQLGCGTMARCLATPGASINFMYLLFTNDTVPDISAEVAAGTVSLSSLQTVSESLNYFRVPVVHVATADGGAGELGGNIVTFHAVTVGSPVGETPVFTDGTSQLYAAALVSGLAGSSANDLLFSVAEVTPITKVANAQLGIRWQVTVNFS